jgi:hypothetical protein
MHAINNSHFCKQDHPKQPGRRIARKAISVDHTLSEIPAIPRPLQGRLSPDQGLGVSALTFLCKRAAQLGAMTRAPDFGAAICLTHDIVIHNNEGASQLRVLLACPSRPARVCVF